MSLDPIPCPRCNSPQKFGIQVRKLEGDYVQLYVKCNKCKWEKVIEEGSRRRLKLQADLRRLREKIRVTGSTSLEDVWERRARKLNE